MRHLLVIACLALSSVLWIDNVFADAQYIKSRLAQAKAQNEKPEDVLAEIFAQAKANKEKPEDTLKDIINADPALAYSALATAVSSYPTLKASFTQVAIDSGLNSQFANAIANAAAQNNQESYNSNITRDSSNRAEVNLNKSGQTVNQSISLPVSSPISSGSTGAGGLLQQTIFIPINNITIPVLNGTNNSVGGGGCGAGTVLTKNETTGVSRCATKS